MLREVLLALLGYTGDVIVRDGASGVFRAARLPFLHASEVAALDRIVVLGWHYASLAEAGAVLSERTGLARALASGVEEALDGYRASVVQAEAAVVKDPGLSLGHLTVHFADALLVLPALDDLVGRVVDAGLTGGALLEAVQAASVSGIPVVAAAVRALLVHLHACWLGWASKWMVHGILDDPDAEWIVQEGSLPSQADSSGQSKGPGPVGGPTHGHNDILSNWAASYSLRLSQLPAYIPPSLAYAMLFAGKAVQVLRAIRKRNELAALLGQSAADEAFPLVVPPPSNSTSPSRPSRSSRSGRGAVWGSESAPVVHLTDAELAGFSQTLETLSKARVFSLSELSAGVESIRSVLARHLFDLIVHEADLMGHIRALKAYALLGAGELYQTFLTESEAVLGTAPTALGAHELRNAFSQAASKSRAEVDPHFGRVSLRVAVDDLPSPVSSDARAWRSILELHYEIPSPVHLVLDDAAMALYGRLFGFLLSVKRVQLLIHAAWVPQMRFKVASGGVTMPLRKLWVVRGRMAFFIDNLQTYLHTDVLEAQAAELEAAIAESPDFEAVKTAHTRYINNLVSLAFLRIKPVINTLAKVFDTVAQFAKLVLTAAETETPVPAATAASLTADFDRQAAFLFTVLSGVKQVHAAPHLAQLLLRIDFNRYFSSSSSTVGGGSSSSSSGSSTNTGR